MSQSNSEIKNVSLELLKILDQLIQPELNNVIFRQAWNSFALAKGKSIILNKPDTELQTLMKKSYNLMKPIFEKVNVASELKESRDINDPSTVKVVEALLKKNKNFSDCLELIP